jgi:hypothetical protein
MNDLLEVTGFHRRTPLLRFLQKGKGVTSLTGEKLYEAQAIEAVRRATAIHGVMSSFYILVADEEGSTYRLFIEVPGGHRPPPALAATVDHHLGELNIEYHAKRASGRLGPLAVVPLAAGAAEAYKAACVRRGQREGQFKPAVLQYAREMTPSLDAYVLSS